MNNLSRTLASLREAKSIRKCFNNSISEQLTKIKTEQRRETTMVDLCAAMDKAARENLQLREPPKKRTSCCPELQPIIDARLQATNNYDYEGVKSTTKGLNKKARQIRTKEQTITFKSDEWDPAKQAKTDTNPNTVK